MKRYFSVWLLSSFVSLTSAQTKPNNNYAFIRIDGKVNHEMRGYWKSIGNGYILDATGDSVLLYSYTTNFCYKEKNDYAEGLLNGQARFKRVNDTISILPTDYGDKTSHLQIKNDYVQINSLPEGTISFSQMTQLGSQTLFDLFVETMQENYAFSKERNMNWKAIHEEYGRKVTQKTTTAELFRIIGDIVTITKDHHTKIISEAGQTLQYKGTKSGDIVAESFKEQSSVKNLNDYINTFFTTNYKNISDSLLHGNGKKVANGKIEWGSLNSSVGYISIYSFTDFAPEGFSRKQQIDSIYIAMEQIIGALANKDVLVLDISFNFGGYDAAFLQIAGFFTDKPTLAYTSQVYNNGRFYDESKVYIYPAGKMQYTKPVYLLMTDISRSAAEGFAMAMKALPQVKLVGTNTMGIQSGMLGKSIGNFYSTSSNQRLLDPHGNFYETTGITPDIQLPVISTGNIFRGHKEAVRTIVDMIGKQ
ncbi:MAG TPA: S41 family peptidase [Flavitalea sp.]|nr:S41 family peptidase [Flavitalea sp.]